ncbi:MAG: S9 family peptidase [Jatrophihabitans sp.]
MTSAIAPLPKKVPVERVHHGDTVVDDYEWLRDKNDPETIAHLEAENAYTAEVTEHLAPLRDSIFAEIKRRTQETDLSVPARRGGWWYYTRTEEGQQYPRWCRCPAAVEDWTPPQPDAQAGLPGEQLLLDGNAEAEGHDFFSLGAFEVSDDATLLAYSTDIAGDERYTVHIKDLTSGELLTDEIPGTLGGLVWSRAGDFLWYGTVNDAWRLDAIWRHRVGTAAADDERVHRETDERFNTGVYRTSSGRFVAIGSHSRITTEALLLDRSDPTGTFRVVVPRETGVEYDISHAIVGGTDRLVVLHNKGAVNFTLGIGPIALSSLGELETLIPAADAVRLTSVATSARHLIVNLREAGLPQVRVLPIDAGPIEPGSNVVFDEELFSAHAGGPSDWEQPFVRVQYASWITPSTVYDLDPATSELHLRKRQPILDGYDPADYVQTREWVTARDGVSVPVSVVRHRSVAERSGAPLMLYGYGSYEHSIDPYVSVPRLSLLDRGVVFAVAHIRGGGEMGRSWYEDGKLLSKKSTFTDFVDAGRHLVDRGWTTPQQMVAHGGSAGGLLVGAAVNEAPELFAGVLAVVAFVDALTTILDPSLPLTVAEWDEWGDPLHDADVYEYMNSYTPYENIAAADYPAIYAPTSLNDTRVFYVEPTKWVARLRERVTGSAPVLLKVRMEGGHGGASGRYDAWHDIADQYAWALDILGLEG